MTRNHLLLGLTQNGINAFELVKVVFSEMIIKKTLGGWLFICKWTSAQILYSGAARRYSAYLTRLAMTMAASSGLG